MDFSFPEQEESKINLTFIDYQKITELLFYKYNKLILEKVSLLLSNIKKVR